MKYKLLLLFISVFISSCNNPKRNDTSASNCYLEKKLSFFDPTSSQWPDSNYYYTTWIRRPENIKFIHENFKKIGYKRIIEYGYFWDWNSEKRPLLQRIDSLIIYYNLDTLESKYYREFWQRRKNEQNSQVVYEALLEIQQILNVGQLDFNTNLINDTLVNLFEITFSEETIDSLKAVNNFNYLVDIGLHQSAYNLLSERYSYYGMKLDSKELSKKLTIDPTCSCILPWLQDNTK